MLGSLTINTHEKRVMEGIKILSFAAIGYLACKYLVTSINPASGVIFSATATATDMVATKFIKANKTDKAIISSLFSFIAAVSLTKYFAKFAVIQALKITVCLTISQLALTTLGIGMMMGSFAILTSIAFKKLG